MTLPDRMRRIETTGEGGPEVLRLAGAPVPRPGPGEVLVRVLAAGVNRPDLLQRAGRYPPPPGASPILGLEVAGEVAACGPGVARPAPGERVAALTNGGGYAEYVAVPAGQCLRWPEGYDAVRAAVLPEACFTVWANLFEAGRLAAGEAALVHGGTGGIGSIAIQLARARGATVYATAGGDAKRETCLRLGAAAAIDYRREDFAARIAELTGGAGVDVVLDVVGAPYTMRNLSSLRPGGRLVQVGLLGGARVRELDLALLMRGQLVVTGSMLRPRPPAEKARLARELEAHVWPLLDDGRVATIVDSVFPLAAAADAHRRLEAGIEAGKIALAVAD